MRERRKILTARLLAASIITPRGMPTGKSSAPAILGTVLPGEILSSTRAAQWYENGAAISGQAGNTLQVPYGARPGYTYSQPRSNVVTVGGAMWDWSTGTLVRTDLAAAPTFTRATTATYIDAAGLVATASINTVRIGRDPITLAVRGVILEAQGTNMCLYSEDLTNGAWNKSSSSVSANTTTAPDGTATADTLVENNANTVHYAIQSIAAAIGTIYTASIYAKAGGRTWISVGLVGLGTTGDTFFDLTNGVVGNVKTGATAGIQALPNGWYRCWVTATATSGTVQIASTLASANGTTSYPGNGTSGAYFWGAQMEVGGMTSYVPTVASQVTRQADTLTVSGLTGFDWSKGIYVAEFGVVTGSGGYGDHRVMTAGTGVDRIQIKAANTGAFYPIGAIGNTSVSSGSVAATTLAERTALSYSTAAGSFFARKSGVGTAVVSATLGNYTGVTSASLALGQTMNGFISRLYWMPLLADATRTQNIAAS